MTPKCFINFNQADTRLKRRKELRKTIVFCLLLLVVAVVSYECSAYIMDLQVDQ